MFLSFTFLQNSNEFGDVLESQNLTNVFESDKTNSTMPIQYFNFKIFAEGPAWKWTSDLYLL